MQTKEALILYHRKENKFQDEFFWVARDMVSLVIQKLNQSGFDPILFTAEDISEADRRVDGIRHFCHCAVIERAFIGRLVREKVPVVQVAGPYINFLPENFNSEQRRLVQAMIAATQQRTQLEKRGRRVA